MNDLTKYEIQSPVSADNVLEMAAEILASKYLRGDVMNSASAVKDFLKYKLANYDREVFSVLLLDSQHHLIDYKELFFGTIDSASIHPREVVKVALQHNAAAVIFAHNHPSGDATPSVSDKNITLKLCDALSLVDVRVLDHIVVGKECVSFAERGFL